MPKPDVTADEAFLLHRALMEVPRSGRVPGSDVGGAAPSFTSTAYATPTSMEPAADLGVLEHTGLAGSSVSRSTSDGLHPVLAHAGKSGPTGR